MTDVALPLFADDDDGAGPQVGQSFAHAHRLRLDEHSWIEQVPGWQKSAADLFEELLDTSEWTQRARWMYTRMVTEPRLTAEFRDLGAAPETLRDAARRLTEHYGVRYDRLWLNLYRDHQDSTGWHGDGASTRRRECVVPVLSPRCGATVPHPPDRGRTEYALPSVEWRPHRHGRSVPGRLAPLRSQAAHPRRPTDQRELRGVEPVRARLTRQARRQQQGPISERARPRLDGRAGATPRGLQASPATGPRVCVATR